MLQQIFIRDFALFAEVTLELGKGLTVLIGETGAGKSILMDAISLGLGDRASGDMVRQGAKKAVIELTFTGPFSQEVEDLFSISELDFYSETLSIRREILASGGSRSFVNDTPTSLGPVRSIGALLLDFHGQHETHGLLSPEGRRKTLDYFAELTQDVELMGTRWRELQDANAALISVVQLSDNADIELQRLTRELKDFTELKPNIGDDTEAIQQLNRLENQTELNSVTKSALDVLTESDESVVNQIRKISKAVKSLSPFNSELLEFLPDLNNAEAAFQELSRSIGRMVDEQEFSPEFLESLRLRVAGMQRLVRKYGSIEGAIRESTLMQNQIEQLHDLEGTLVKARERVSTAKVEAENHAIKLSTMREGSAKVVSLEVTRSLKDLGMPNALFEVSVDPCPLNKAGSDSVGFQLQSNKGDSLRSIEKVASGGELSRIMLCVRKAIANKQNTSTMVLDEIDTGISGKVARQVGELMHNLSKEHQLVCVTHLAQIASLADNIVRVEKNDVGKETLVDVKYVFGSEAELEIAKLISGSTVTEKSLASAKELILNK